MSEHTMSPKKEPTKSVIEMASRMTAALARRLAPGGAVFGGGTKAIPLTAPGWHTRFFNSEVHDQRHYEAIHEKGYVPVLPSDLPGTPEEFGLRVNESGYLVRGARGNELFCKIPKEAAEQIQQLKTAANMRGLGSASKTRDALAQAVGAAHGAEAGDYIHEHVSGHVIDSRGPRDAA